MQNMQDNNICASLVA